MRVHVSLDIKNQSRAPGVSLNMRYTQQSHLAGLAAGHCQVELIAGIGFPGPVGVCIGLGQNLFH